MFYGGGRVVLVREALRGPSHLDRSIEPESRSKSLEIKANTWIYLDFTLISVDFNGFSGDFRGVSAQIGHEVARFQAVSRLFSAPRQAFEPSHLDLRLLDVAVVPPPVQTRPEPPAIGWFQALFAFAGAENQVISSPRAPNP